ncbi:DUF4194 domain-containing protein [Curtobacterium caseinilyticum]|uniref:DUF4194 domain-containing protein n=1 Tax=Curtobacterium caseinilyticum TaxID=3055137 RepID=A0ABT7TKP4_9MICO|nr:DUF4194 domain-containing protein [Curtobacterium caseinilyticum]MDM7890151.1 DUF4194 domain-containing protein [Curtobacterium caseinilyticum]
MSDTTTAPVDETDPDTIDPVDVDTALDERDETSFALFEGDEGRLDEPQRRALVALLRHTYVSARTHADEWRAITDGEHQLRSRLNDLFLELHVDRDREVAWKRQARSESQRRAFPTLLRDVPYTREETIVLVYLRMRLRADARPGLDQVVVDRSEILGHVSGFLPATTDRTRDESRVAKALERLVTARILIRTSDPDRFRVASVVEVLLPLEQLRELDRWLQTVGTARSEDSVSDDATVGSEDGARTAATTLPGDERDGGAPRLPADHTDTDDEGETDA